MGLYNSVTVLNTYRTDKEYSLQQLNILFSNALSHVLTEHAALCYGLHGEATKTPCYVPVDAVDLTQKLSFRRCSDDNSMMRELEAEHDTQWDNQETVPPWKVLVFQKQGDSKSLSVAFVYHHGLADGLSGAAVHTSLLSSLTILSSQPDLPVTPATQVELSNVPTLPPPIEELVKFKTSWSFLISQVLQEYGPRILFGKKNNHFAGLDCELSEQLPYRTRLRLLELDPNAVKALLARCKPKKISCAFPRHGCSER